MYRWIVDAYATDGARRTRQKKQKALVAHHSQARNVLVYIHTHLDGRLDRSEVDGLEDVPVELGGLLRLEREPHLRKTKKKQDKKVSKHTESQRK